MSWKIELDNGIYLPDIDWRLDARKPVEKAFVSHAHFDHLGDHQSILCSDVTAKLIQARLEGEREWLIHEFEKPFEIEPGVEAVFYPAGHIVGSSMLWLKREGVSLLYTGDFKLTPGKSAEPCVVPEADILVMETTYGLPRYVFPPAEEVIKDIIRFCQETLENGDTPILFGYSLGKSQEALSSLKSANLKIMMHPQPAKLTRTCMEIGIEFPEFSDFDEENYAGHVVISPPLSNKSSWLKRIRNRKTAMLSGWANDPNAIYRFQCDKVFPLSDHADFLDLQEMVSRVQPSRILTIHGYAEEFAQTLKQDGYDAFALGKDNQMSFDMKVEMPNKRFSVAHSERDDDPEHQSEDAFVSFCHLCGEIGNTDSKNRKIELLARFLEKLEPEDSAHVCLFLTGRAFPQSSKNRLNIGWSLVKQSILDATEASEADFKFLYKDIRDASEVAVALLKSLDTKAQRSIRDIRILFENLAIAPSPTFRHSLLKEEFRKLSPIEGKYFMKVISGDLRIGMKEGLVEEAIAKRYDVDKTETREANLRCGDIVKVVLAASKNQLESIRLEVFHPLQFMLASPEPDGESIVKRLGESVWAEDKYDGIRCQIHKVDQRVELYSRDLNQVSHQFPEIVSAIREIPQDFIGDGEIVAWSDEKPLPFAELQKRLGRKGGDLFLGEEIPVILWLYDALWIEGNSLLKTPLSDRRNRMEQLSLNATIRMAPTIQLEGAKAIEAAFVAARQRGNEGLMLKDPASFYTPGSRGNAWLKLKKAYAALDVVVVAAEYGHGKRKDVLSDYTFAVRDSETGELKTIGKAYTGLRDVEIEELTYHFKEQTIEDKGHKKIVKPDTVLEIAFDTIQRSDRHNSGFALRFPRIKRIRSDKSVEQIDTLEQCERLCSATENESGRQN